MPLKCWTVLFLWNHNFKNLEHLRKKTFLQSALNERNILPCQFREFTKNMWRTFQDWPFVQIQSKTVSRSTNIVCSHPPYWMLYLGWQIVYSRKGGWLGRAMVLGSFQCLGILLLWHMVGQGPALPAAGAGRVGSFLFFHLVYLPFLMPHLVGDGWTYWNIVVSAVITQTVVVGYYWRHAP